MNDDTLTTNNANVNRFETRSCLIFVGCKENNEKMYLLMEQSCRLLANAPADACVAIQAAHGFAADLAKAT